MSSKMLYGYRAKEQRLFLGYLKYKTPATNMLCPFIGNVLSRYTGSMIIHHRRIVEVPPCSFEAASLFALPAAPVSLPHNSVGPFSASAA
jgi:hypothetical protein